jgi:hypothetical protein
MNKLISCFALAPPNANRLTQFFFSIIRSLENGKTATETVLCYVSTSEHYIAYVDTAGMKTPNSKTDVIISIVIQWEGGGGKCIPINFLPKRCFLATEMKRCKYIKLR